ncbi:MAG: SPASM domain-containing protein [Cyclobacteriaceae bacterium]
MCDVGTHNFESNFAQNLVGTHPINMPLDLVKKVIDQTAQYFPKSQLAYAFTEPIIYPYLLESLNYANNIGLFTSITTNALTLRNLAKGIAKAELNELYVSLDGPQEIHNKIRGHKESFQRAIDGIKKLRFYGAETKITIICAITEWNIGHLKQFSDSFIELGIDEIAFMHTQYTDPKMANIHNAKWGNLYPATDSNLDEVNFDNMDLDILLEEIGHIKSSKYPYNIYFSPEISEANELRKYYYEPDTFIGNYCSAVFTSIMVKSDGSVIPAHGRCYNIDIGNIYKESLKDIWNSSVISTFRSRLMSEGGFFPACSRCCSAF